MRVLVTWGSKRGGTEELARQIGETLRGRGFDVELQPASAVGSLDAFDAVVVGGALYANRWHRDARKFVARHARGLRRLPVWLFSSGPLDDSAAQREIAPTAQVRALMDRIGALGHATFGGRLAPDAKGFPASAMAKTHAGDWRDPARVRAWANDLARDLPEARHGIAIVPNARSLTRLFAHAVPGWAVCALAMDAVQRTASLGSALAIHALLAPLVFAFVAAHYFHRPGARDPLPTALAFAGTVAALDLGVVAGLMHRSLAMVGSVVGTWLPLASIVLVTWAIGGLMSTMPWPKPAHR